MVADIENFLETLKSLQNLNTEFPLQYIICLITIALEEGICTTDLAQRTGMALSTVSRITTALSKKDGTYELITIEIVPNEKRRKRIFLSEKGQITVNQIKQHLGNEQICSEV